MKSALQQRLAPHLESSNCRRGYVANCGNIAAGTSFQFATAVALNKLVLRGERRDLTDAEKACTGSGHVFGVLTSGSTLVTVGGTHKDRKKPSKLMAILSKCVGINVLRGFLAGFASGVVASPAELVMTQQQLKGGSVLQNVSWPFQEYERLCVGDENQPCRR